MTTPIDLNEAAKALAEELQGTYAGNGISLQTIHKHLTAISEQWGKRVQELETETASYRSQRRQMMDEALYYRELMRACGMQFCADCAWPIWPCKEHICGGKAVSHSISQSEHEKLRTERDQLTAQLEAMDESRQYLQVKVETLERERDQLTQKVKALEDAPLCADHAQLWYTARHFEPGECWMCDKVKLQLFKDWVHAYLDSKGVPHHPPGSHGAEGCRIGDRLDWVMAQVNQLAHQQVKDSEAAADRSAMSLREANYQLLHITAERDQLAGQLEQLRAAHTKSRIDLTHSEILVKEHRNQIASLRAELAKGQSKWSCICGAEWQRPELMPGNTCPRCGADISHMKAELAKGGGE